jgi:signal transduction histidine kinase
MVRQSALISIFDHNNFSVLDFRGLQKEQLPTQEHIPELLEMGGKYIPPHKIRRFPRHLHWIKVILPLTFDDDIIGLWLLGRRDPNDVYEATLIEMLYSLANQTSIAMVNHRQTQSLRALYQANIDRHENERASLARELHDSTLNNLALLQRETKNQVLTHDIENIIAKLRKTIRGLRPEMLSYGLMTALQDLGDTLNERQSKTEVLVALEGTPTNIASKIELHLFRIVQQACENALLHAHAKNLKIVGEISEGRVNVRIEDNGVGFETGRSLMLSDLLANKHYGLAGMHERAALIGAKINIQSKPAKGTTILIDWQQQ